MLITETYMLNGREFTKTYPDENKEYRDSTEKRFANYYKKRRSMWNQIPVNDKMIISNQVRSCNVAEGMMMEAVIIDNWLKHIQKLAK